MTESEPAPDPAPGECLGATQFIDSDAAGVRDFAARTVAGQDDATGKAVALYYAVRDGIVYDPYDVELSEAAFRASNCLARGRGFCITKAALLAAVARASGIPARIGFADVRNHLATERLRRLMGGTDIFYYHGYTELFLEGRWVKATPAFNIGLCERFRVRPLDFDGRSDSIFHPFDADNRRHMEYVAERGTFADVPFRAIRENFRLHYPALMREGAPGGDFAAEAEAEAGRGAPRAKH
ncbi:MAG: transglutaminase domain-containing protein [Alphaproteobacteria bacterium]|nr:transglutaminase domain-containing protein [Alphaproteobacteria bacterium]